MKRKPRLTQIDEDDLESYSSHECDDYDYDPEFDGYQPSENEYYCEEI